MAKMVGSAAGLGQDKGPAGKARMGKGTVAKANGRNSRLKVKGKSGAKPKTGRGG